MRDYCDGIVAKKHPLFSTSMGSLQILLYYDDLEVCNPLGSRKSIHKLGNDIKYQICMVFFLIIGLFYFTFGNYRNRSVLRNIHLVAIAKTSLIKKYTMSAVLSPLIKDVQKLVSFMDPDVYPVIHIVALYLVINKL